MRPVDVREAFSIFYRRRRLAVAVALAALVGTWIGNWLVYPSYRSTVRILVERAPGSEIPFSREQIAFKKAEITQTQCELLQSTPVLESAVRELHLDTRPLPSGSLRDRIHEIGWQILDRISALKDNAKRFVIVRVFGKTWRPPAPSDTFREAVEDLRAQIEVEPIPNTDLIAVTVRDRDPEMAARIANLIAEIYLARDVESQKQRARLVYDLINNQVTELRPAYDAAEKAMETFERQHNARLLEDQIRSKIQEISSLELTYAELVETQSTKIATLYMELARLQQLYEPNHPKVLAARSELREAERSLARKSTRPSEGVDEDYAGALRERIARAKEELAELSRLDGEYARLERRKQQEEELYLSLKKKREEAQVAEATRAAGTRVVDPAVPALQPASPRKRLNLLLGLLGGLFIAGTLAALLEFLDRSVKTPADITAATGLDQVWSVPDFRRSRLFGGAS